MAQSAFGSQTSAAYDVVAVVLIAVAYAYPLFHMLTMERFGSPGFTPF